MRKRTILGGVLAVATLGMSGLAAPATAAPDARLADVIPAPVEVRPNPAADFWINPATQIRTQPGAKGAKRVGDYLAGVLRPATGYPLPVAESRYSVLPTISLVLGDAEARIGKQGYQLDVTRKGVTIRANSASGLFAGVQTLRQLLPAEIESSGPRLRAWTVPGGRILDYPRFGYRGAMLDLARHFHTVPEIKRYIDDLARYKINHLHLHLADDQGWRIQIDSWPKLTAVGGGQGTGVDGAGGGYLTKADYAELNEYAAARQLTIVPEIDMPGHTNAALSSYAELNCDGVAPPPRTDMEVGYSSLCVGKENTYAFVEDVIREVAAMTPGPYLHLGGDEAEATTDADYRTFMRRVIPLVGKYGKRLAGWHEIAQADLPASAVPQFWDSAGGVDDNVARAAGNGSKILLSPANKSYLDMKYNENTELGLTWAGPTEVRDAYDWDPASAVRGVGERSVLGVEAPLWSETVRSIDDIEFLAFPRLPAIAEKGWSAKAGQDWESFRQRLAGHGPRWDLGGVNYYRSPQIPWPG
ncbi:MAG: family 20 glycosylhydrolase [Pseudonocardiaceae bacterium]|nr:family 20 glycosylhydrolase [Pseudonocardiaceae bacterium]